MFLQDLFTQSVFWVLVGIVFIVMTVFEYFYSYWKNLKVPTLPATIPFGHYRPFIMQTESFGQNLMDLYFKLKTYGKAYGGTYVFTKPVLVILDPELSKTILIKDFNHFTDRSIADVDEKTNPLQNHLLHMKGEKWNKLRSKISPAFTSGKIKSTFLSLKIVTKNLENVLETLENSSCFDVQDLMERFTTDVIGSVVFGLVCNSLEIKGDVFRKNSNRGAKITWFENFVKLLSVCFPSIGRNLQLKFIPDDVKNYFINLVKDSIDYRKKNGIKKDDFLQILMNLHLEENQEKDKTSGKFWNNKFRSYLCKMHFGIVN